MVEFVASLWIGGLVWVVTTIGRLVEMGPLLPCVCGVIWAVFMVWLFLGE